MKQAMDNNYLVFLHCKSGVGRSATLAAAHLAIYPPNNSGITQYNLREALIYLKIRRPQLNLHEELVKDDEWDESGCLNVAMIDKKRRQLLGNLIVVNEVIKLHKRLHEKIRESKGLEVNENELHGISDYIDAFNESAYANQQKNENEDEGRSSFLSSLAFKNSIVRLNSFKQLKLAATQESGLFYRYTYNLCQKIFMAKDDKWFEERFNAGNPIHKLLNFPYLTTRQRNLIAVFIHDIKRIKAELLNLDDLNENAFISQKQSILEKKSIIKRDYENVDFEIFDTLYRKILTSPHLRRLIIHNSKNPEKFELTKAYCQNIRKQKNLKGLVDAINANVTRGHLSLWENKGYSRFFGASSQSRVLQAKLNTLIKNKMSFWNWNLAHLLTAKINTPKTVLNTKDSSGSEHGRGFG